MLIRSILLLMFGAAGVAFWQAEARAELEQRTLLRSLAAQLEPFGTLSHREASAHCWGSGEIQELRFVPSEELRGRYGLPPDLSLSIPRLHYSGWERGVSWPTAITLSFDNATLSLDEPWPSSASGTLDWRYRPDDGDLRISATLDSPRAAAAQASLALRLASVEHLAGATLVNGTLRFNDLGLVQNARSELAMRLGADSGSAESALTDTLVQWLTGIGLPPDGSMRSALVAFAREPLALKVQLDPPGVLKPENLPLFAPKDRVAVLGLSIDIP